MAQRCAGVVSVVRPAPRFQRDNKVTRGKSDATPPPEGSEPNCWEALSYTRGKIGGSSARSGWHKILNCGKP